MARTIGKRNIARVKNLTAKYCKDRNITCDRIEDLIIGDLGEDVMGIWESAHDEVRRIVGDLVMVEVHQTRRSL